MSFIIGSVALALTLFQVSNKGSVGEVGTSLNRQQAVAAKDTSTESLKRLQGTWTLSAVEQAGRRIEGDGVSQWLETSPTFGQLIIRGKVVTFPFLRVPPELQEAEKGSPLNQYNLRIEPEVDPTKITFSRGPVVLGQGTYKYADRKLVLILSTGRGPAPTSFETKNTGYYKFEFVNEPLPQESEPQS